MFSCPSHMRFAIQSVNILHSLWEDVIRRGGENKKTRGKEEKHPIGWGNGWSLRALRALRPFYEHEQ